MQPQEVRKEPVTTNLVGHDQEGMVAWDQKGLVVMWPDGHRSRLSWAALRASCQCAECRERRANTLTPVQEDTGLNLLRHAEDERLSF
jgi:DUF971 family protein